MAAVYEVLCNSDAFQSLDWDGRTPRGKDFMNRFEFKGEPMAADWDPPELYVKEPLQPAPDIWGGMKGPLFEERVVDALLPILEPVGELLPVPFEGRMLYALNVTYLPDCLDVEQSEFPAEFPDLIQTFAFHVTRIEHSIFKIPQKVFSSPFTIQGHLPPEREFMAMIEKHGFKGLHYAEIWPKGWRD